MLVVNFENIADYHFPHSMSVSHNRVWDLSNKIRSQFKLIKVHYIMLQEYINLHLSMLLLYIYENDKKMFTSPHVHFKRFLHDM